MRLPCRLPLRPSPSLGLALVFFHALVLAGLVFTAWVQPPQRSGMVLVCVAASLLCLVSLGQGLRRWHSLPATDLLLTRNGLTLLDVTEDSTISRFWPVQVLAETTVFSWLVCLHWQDSDGRRQSLTLPADALPQGTHRLLRLWLKAGKGGKGVDTAGQPP